MYHLRFGPRRHDLGPERLIPPDSGAFFDVFRRPHTSARVPLSEKEPPAYVSLSNSGPVVCSVLKRCCDAISEARGETAVHAADLDGAYVALEDALHATFDLLAKVCGDWRDSRVSGAASRAPRKAFVPSTRGGQASPRYGSRDPRGEGLLIPTPHPKETGRFWRAQAGLGLDGTGWRCHVLPDGRLEYRQGPLGAETGAQFPRPGSRKPLPEGWVECEG